MTGEYVYLPEMDFGEISRPEVLGGFGYCQSNNEYKVIQVTYEYNQFEQLGRVQVYTLGSGSRWRNKGEMHYTSKERLVLANEALYWLENIEDEWNLRAFHLADETFGTVPMPPCHDVVRGYIQLVSLNGCLCVYHVTVERCSEQEDDAYYRKEDKRIDMWILKKVHKKNNVRYSPVDENDDSNLWVWIREISMKYKTEFPDFRHYESFSITSNNQVLMWEVCDVQGYKTPICYDPNTTITNYLWNTGVLYAQAIPHMSSFVSLEDLGEKSAR
ncbi:F-box protein At3g07870-like [Papaver somniferum]|uniref:F-box protein At3g07870-like n=1 Tax=Papaver somniferum TaxID=3469 RepID=UPI000E70492D|nr:F-box protein At3g07870-like [Papaver somniferum]